MRMLQLFCGIVGAVVFILSCLGREVGVCFLCVAIQQSCFGRAGHNLRGIIYLSHLVRFNTAEVAGFFAQ